PSCTSQPGTQEHPATVRRTSTLGSGENEEEEAELKYGASHVINLFVPVSICMVMVVFTMNTVTFYSYNDGRHLLYTPFVKETDSTSEKVLMSLGNALVMLCVVIIMTVILIVFYKYRCYKVITAWLMVSSCLLLFLFSTIYFAVLKSFTSCEFSFFQRSDEKAVETTASMFSLRFFLLLDSTCLTHCHPFFQFYLIAMSALMALVFIKYLPEWTVWSVLAVISVWDLIAVLAPNGPLRILVETAQERNEPIFPALIYSLQGIVFPFVCVAVSGFYFYLVFPISSNLPLEFVFSCFEACFTAGMVPSFLVLHNVVQICNISEGVKLGLGDFIFYSVLVGKASSYFDWNTTVACYVAILVGLCFTLLLLAVFRRALPALPISIFAGLLFYFCTRWIVTPYVSEITRRQWVY
ncbi:unnamed protein product, partial [Angiostrongylus costaricensis]|uniref:Presenilin n=1 Tax=Angiostrongylus costaricensis TaxID=334426 RepID=A0A0R3PEK8_ANGCS